MAEWQPIETAPKDGTRILLSWRGAGLAIGWWKENHRIEKAYFSATHELDDYECVDYTPTHWMPLPARPA